MRLPKLSSVDDNASPSASSIQKRTIPAYFEAKPVSRRDALQATGDPDALEDFDPDQEVVRILNEAVSSSIEVGIGESRKRRRLIPDDEGHSDEPLLFRLVSGKPLLPVSLEPPPPPPAVLKVLDPEDDEETAQRRHEIACLTAVDATWLVKEANKHDPTRKGKSVVYPLPSGSETPALLVLSKLQPPRSTRPPGVDTSSLHYPYNATTFPQSESLPKAKCCPIFDIPPSAPAASTPSSADPPHPNSRRSRKRRRLQDRPPPSFWKPPANVKGKCLGYAYGYPSSYANIEEWQERGIVYRRDILKRIKLSA
ncbi:hypothetical protein BKA70DRAFT_718229 [Coprinopsis sp. MPI-PUGE-AT-0042]|nr:hypothetical protein BKA70DRAFT_718229 [Coprinopsis sp. MPI-PUGE-AT-0042]